MARLTPIRHPDTRRLMPNILTLATPHGNPLYAFDETIHKLHKSLLNNQHDASSTLLVSISGGVRDEMIAPKACEVSPDIDHTSHSVRMGVLLCRRCNFSPAYTDDSVVLDYQPHVEWTAWDGSSSHRLVSWRLGASAQSDLEPFNSRLQRGFRKAIGKSCPRLGEHVLS